MTLTKSGEPVPVEAGRQMGDGVPTFPTGEPGRRLETGCVLLWH